MKITVTCLKKQHGSFPLLAWKGMGSLTCMQWFAFFYHSTDSHVLFAHHINKTIKCDLDSECWQRPGCAMAAQLYRFPCSQFTYNFIFDVNRRGRKIY